MYTSIVQLVYEVEYTLFQKPCTCYSSSVLIVNKYLTELTKQILSQMRYVNEKCDN